jgi:ABC-2 type transport system ATP-binding protein
VKLKVLAPPETVGPALAGLPYVQKVAPGPGGSVIVTFVGDDQALGYIVRALVMANLAVVGVEPERNELERIFLEVTKGEVQ